MTIGKDRILGQRLSHYESCYPYSRENMRFAFADVPGEVRMMLGENAAALYGFDLDALRSLLKSARRRSCGPTSPADSTCTPSSALARRRRWRQDDAPARSPS